MRIATEPSADPDPGTVDDTLAAHWRAWRVDGCLRAREALFVHYRRYAIALATGHHQPRGGVELDELRQSASVALLEAINRFEPERGVRFETYATHYLRGALLKGLERHSEVHAQRAFRARVRRERLASIKDGLPAQASARDTLTQVATGLLIALMLEDTGLVADGEHTPSPLPAPYASAAWAQQRRRLHAYVATLPEPQARVLRLHYLHELPFVDIATMIGLSPSRVSHLHRAALQALRQQVLAARTDWGRE